MLLYRIRGGRAKKGPLARRPMFEREEEKEMEMLKRFWKEEEGMGTIELVMIIAALMCVALMFRNQITTFVSTLLGKIMDTSLVEDVTGETKS